MTATATVDAPATPPATPYERIGGGDAVRALVDRFYDVMDVDPAYAELRALHGADLTPMRASLTGFLNGWLGGPRDWFGQGKCVMSAHARVAVTAKTAQQWGDAMGHALNDGEIDAELRAAIATAFARMAAGMTR
jgi:hemoglobin